MIEIQFKAGCFITDTVHMLDGGQMLVNLRKTNETRAPKKTILYNNNKYELT